MDDYSALVRRLFATQFFGGMKLGLQNAMTLSELLNHPQKKFSSILIAGTNGKGSVATKIAKVLELSGHRVGLFTSPHIASFRERIQVNGCLVTREEIVKYLPPLFHLVESHQIPATFFELTTLLAFKIFSERQVDYSVIEVGLGGRLDATNILNPILSVITSIGYDHMNQLGNTLDQIAMEKGGIIKPGVPVVLGPQAQLNVLLDLAKQKGASVYPVASTHAAFYDEENKSIAASALNRLSQSVKINDHALDVGLMQRPICRFEEWTQAMLLLQNIKTHLSHLFFDVAHNCQGIEKVMEALTVRFPDKPITCLVGLSQDKDVDSCLKVLSHYMPNIIFGQANHYRASSANDLLSRYPYYNATAVKSIKEGMNKLLNTAVEGSIGVVLGSFFIMKEAKDAINVNQDCDGLNLN
ncbi:MAG: hypothetical protein JHC93_06345 [Parachlamydiales bacterium]|nr:hypothetical protein [Parachlamydiales bacterium]